jgi:hypothetical protein
MWLSKFIQFLDILFLTGPIKDACLKKVTFVGSRGSENLAASERREK